MVMNDKIIKTKARCPKTFARAFSVREIAEKIWGSLKVADSFLYLYCRFGTPCCDTRDEYKIAYEYSFWYKGLYFTVTGSTPEFVYLDCCIPKKYFLLQRSRYRKEVRSVFDKALKDDILCWPWANGFSQIADSLTKAQMKAYNAKFDEEARGFFSEEDYNWLDSRQHEKLEGEDAVRCINLMEGLYKHLQEKFKKWAGNDKSIKEMFWTQPDLRYLPEVEKIIKSFCRELLKTEPIRDRDINIQGWK